MCIKFSELKLGNFVKLGKKWFSCQKLAYCKIQNAQIEKRCDRMLIPFIFLFYLNLRKTELGKWSDRKRKWTEGSVLLPSDKMVSRNQKLKMRFKKAIHCAMEKAEGDLINVLNISSEQLTYNYCCAAIITQINTYLCRYG